MFLFSSGKYSFSCSIYLEVNEEREIERERAAYLTAARCISATSERK